MSLVHFALHRFTTDVEQHDEATIFDDPALVAWLCDVDELEGALQIGGATVTDDLVSAVQRLCFECVGTVIEPGTIYSYRYFTANAELSLTTSADGKTVALAGDDVPSLTFDRQELVRDLVACGDRFLAFLVDLGKRGRTSSEYQLEQLRPYADDAHSVLLAHGLG